MTEFYEEDEPVEKIQAAFDAGPHGTTDWVDDPTMSREETLARFEALNPEMSLSIEPPTYEQLKAEIDRLRAIINAQKKWTKRTRELVRTMRGAEHRAKWFERRAHRAEREIGEYHQLIVMQGDLLTGVANALRGDPPPLTMWDHSDLPARAAAMAAEVDDKAQRLALSGARLTKSVQRSIVLSARVVAAKTVLASISEITERMTLAHDERWAGKTADDDHAPIWQQDSKDLSGLLVALRAIVPPAS